MNTNLAIMLIVSTLVILVTMVLLYPIGKHLPEDETFGAKTLGGAMVRAATSEYSATTNRAELVSVLITLKSLGQVLASDYHYNGAFSESLEDAGIHLDSGTDISRTSMQNGTLTAHLTTKFGKAKFVRMEPQFDSAGELAGWQMTSNIDNRKLSGTGIESAVD